MNIVFIFRIVHALFAIITLYFITQYLTPQEQGWYYTFLSFSALIHLLFKYFFLLIFHGYFFVP